MKDQFLYKQNNEEEFWRHWNALAQKLGAGPSYTRLNIEWSLSISKARSLLIEDRSFVYIQNSVPVAAVFLPFENVEGQVQGSSCGGYIYAPLCINHAIAKEVFGQIDLLANELKAKKISFSIDSLMNAKYNFLQQFNFLDTSILDYHINTSIEPAAMIKESRHGHRSDLNKLLRDTRVTTRIMSLTNADVGEHELYRALHRKAAGRETRPKETFDIQFKKVEADEAFLCSVLLDGSLAACGYFEYCNGQAVYASGADDPAVSGVPLYHALVYAAMVELHKRNVARLSVGQPASPSAQLDFYPDKKQLDIARFKRGFAGSYASCFRGIKYYAKDAFERDLALFSKKYLL